MKSPFSRLAAFTHRAGTSSMSPERDWIALLIGSLLLLLIIIGWHVWAFEVVVSGGALGDTHPKSAPGASASALDIVPGLLDARAAEDTNYVNGVYRFTDPSQ